MKTEVRALTLVMFPNSVRSRDHHYRLLRLKLFISDRLLKALLASAPSKQNRDDSYNRNHQSHFVRPLLSRLRKAL